MRVTSVLRQPSNDKFIALNIEHAGVERHAALEAKRVPRAILAAAAARLQDYDRTEAQRHRRDRAGDKPENQLTAKAEGYRFELIRVKPEIKVRQAATDAKLKVTKASDRGFDQLEPVRAAFAHIAGFNEDGETVLAMRPTGAPILQESARGGPEFAFQISRPKPASPGSSRRCRCRGNQALSPSPSRVHHKNLPGCSE